MNRVVQLLIAAIDEPSRTVQSGLAPAGPQASQISNLWWIFFAVTAAIFLLTMGFLILSMRRSGSEPGPVLPPDPKTDSRMAKVVGGLVVLSLAVLLTLLISDFRTGRAIAALNDPDPLVIRVTARQWWWEFEYQDATPANIARTANEIHLPIGRAIRFDLRSLDVIHSFWIPNLLGKKDAIPGHPVSTWAQADREGTFRGQCAEYCGAQHAKSASLWSPNLKKSSSRG